MYCVCEFGYCCLLLGMVGMLCMFGYVWVCSCMCPEFGICLVGLHVSAYVLECCVWLGMFVYVWVCVGMFGYGRVCLGVFVRVCVYCCVCV